MAIESGKEQTFTVTTTPKRPADRKTIQRLMRMQTGVQRGLDKLSKRRRQKDNVTYVRAGRPWTNRATMTRLTSVRPGEEFTIFVTPQIVPDIRSVEEFLEVK